MKKSIKEISFGASISNEPNLIITLDNGKCSEKLIKEYLLTSGVNIHKANEFLRSLNTEIEIKFENFNQYYKLLKNISILLNIPFTWFNKEENFINRKDIKI